jgi:hypothetical protein
MGLSEAIHSRDVGFDGCVLSLCGGCCMDSGAPFQ